MRSFTAAEQDEWLWGWDSTPGIVSVWADMSGRALIWRRPPATGELVREEKRFRAWALLPSLELVSYLDADLVHAAPGEEPHGALAYHTLEGPGRFAYYVSASDGRALESALLAGASARLGRKVTRLGELDDETILFLPPEEQYLVASGRTYFRDLPFDALRRLQFDLETTGLNPEKDAIFLVSVRDSAGLETTLDVAERGLTGPTAEADLIRRLCALVCERDPDVIENHNLHGFDLPFLVTRARIHNVRLTLGRIPHLTVKERAAGRGYRAWGNDESEAEPEGERPRAVRYAIPGRELIDTLDAVRRYDFAVRDLPGHGLKAVAKHFGLAPADREYVQGDQIYATWTRDPERVRHYALDDVREVAGLARMLGGAAFALAQMAPRRYERLADAGPATGVLDPLLVRAYLRAGEALPAQEKSHGVEHTGAALYLFAAGVARRIVKADVSSLYPSLMRQYHIGPRSDRLGALLALVDRLVEARLAAKTRAKTLPPGSSERYTDEALSGAMKILVNSAYGYLGAVGLTRFSDVDAANEITARGRDLLALMCRELAARGVTLLEADTDGVYFAAPSDWDEDHERAVVAEVAALLPPLVKLEFEGRYAAMLSHQPKNYALLTYDDKLLLRGVAFRSSRSEPYGEAFLRRAVACLLRDDVPGVRAVYVETLDQLRARLIATEQVAISARLSKTREAYESSRAQRRELPYEALLAAGQMKWKRGDRVRVYRATGGAAALLEENGDGAATDPRHYDVAYYARLLRETFAARLERAFTPDDFAALFADPQQPSLFAPPIEAIQPTLTPLLNPRDLR
jgi:DNA polymerase elongation subunit (family B)